MTTLCIDARLYGIAHTGIGRYTQELIRHLPKIPAVRVVIICHPAARDSVLSHYETIPAFHHPYSALSQLEMAKILWRLQPDLLHVPHFTVPVFWWGKTVITIHDLIKHKSKGPATTTHNPLAYWPKYLAYRLLVSYALRRAVHIITPSNYWRDVLISDSHLPPDRITVTYEGVDSHFFASPLDQPAKPYLIYAGNVYPHKNLPVLISAAAQLNLPLKIICARDVFASRLPHSDRIEFLGRVSDAQAKQHYRHALAFVFPSLYEGFGLPGLEAMAAGLPVIAARSSCFPEVYRDAALYFAPHSTADLVSQITRLRSDPQLRRTLITRGQVLAKTYTWTKMAALTCQIYRTALP